MEVFNVVKIFERLLSSITRVIVCGKDAVMVVAFFRIVTVAVLTATPHGILSTASLPRMIEAASQLGSPAVVNLDAAQRSGLQRRVQ